MMTLDDPTAPRSAAPSSTAAALTRPSAPSANRTLADLTDDELRTLAAVVVHERPTLATRAFAARVPLAVAASSLLGAAAAFWLVSGVDGRDAALGVVLGSGLSAAGLSSLVLQARTPRFSVLAPAVAFLDERGVAPREHNGILRRIAATLRGKTRAADIDEVYRCLAPWGARDDTNEPAPRQAHRLPAALLTGIARDWLASRPKLLLLVGTLGGLPSMLRLTLPPLIHALLLSVYVGSWVAALVKRKQPMRKAFLAPLQLELDDDEEERLVQAFNAALTETRRERRRLSLDDAAGVLVQTVLAHLGETAPVDSALNDERRRLLHDRAAEPVPATRAAATGAPQPVGHVVVDEAVVAKRS